eukprot:11828281-Heterocapsa_arctica.AAC.1
MTLSPPSVPLGPSPSSLAACPPAHFLSSWPQPDQVAVVAPLPPPPLPLPVARHGLILVDALQGVFGHVLTRLLDPRRV